jgi:hypothetical protein
MTFLQQLLSGAQSVVAFADASRCLREAEVELKERLLAVGDRPKPLRFPNLDLTPQAYWERNFFSILFVSIFQAIGIEKARIRHYAAIIHMVRGIVTATDNILDDENKGAVLLDLHAGKVLPNVLSMLLQAGELQRSIRLVMEDDEAARRAWGLLLDRLYIIGEEESGEEATVEEVLPPKRLLDEIHRFRGANLLLLAFAVPELNEPDFADEIEHAKAGVFRIGLALQVLDDLADFDEDITHRNHNLLRSWLVHGSGNGGKATPIADSALSAYSPEQRSAPHELFPEAVGEVMVLAIELALTGFERLRQARHSLDRETAREMIAAMFRLRGLPQLWERYVAFSQVVDMKLLEPYFEGF